MAIPFKKYGYTINPITDEIETPQVFLVNKRLKKIGELYPVENLRITVNEVNQPDEVSFTYYKEINGGKSPYFNEIDDLSVIQVGDFGFFECSVSKNQNASILKTVTAKSLGYAELSQTLHTLEVNTEDDMKRSDYDMDYPTIFYREIPVGTDEETARKLRESSLFDRILTEAPNYKIGHVDTTLWYVQRTFSWSDTDIVSIFNEVEKEIGCIFDIQVRVGDDGEVERIVNAYDMQYCSHCWEEAKISGEKATSSTSKFRNIVNGVCQNCGESKYIKDIGDDSGIYISTDNLSDDISINGDPDSIKNCLKITGGDDVITATVQGLNMSASGKIMAFSDLQKKAMSPELKEKLDTYNSDYKNNIVDYEALLETEYNMQDIRLYLQSGKMPQIEKEIKTTDEALYSVLSNIEKHFNAKFFISSYNNYYKYPTSSARTSISNMFTTFMPEGFSMTIDKSNNEEDVPGKVFDPNAIYGWYGTVKVYSTGNRDDSYTLHITKSNGTYVTSGTSEEHYISSDASIQSMVDNFRIQFYFADQTQEEYKEYLEQYTTYLLSTVDLTYENEQKKEWDKYGYNLLKSYADGYQKCIETIDDMLSTADGESQKILNETREKYVSIQSDILLQMNVLEDQIFAICRYLGGSYDDSYLNDNGEISYNYKYYKDDKKATIQEIFDHMINPDYVGGYNDDQTVYTPNEYIGDKPFKCLKCNSSNVAVSTEGNVCRNNGCGAKGSDIYTYRDMMENIADSYREHYNSGKTIVELRTDYRNQFDMKTYLGDTLYIELRSFIREDVYNNSNFTSDGLSNAQIIEQAKELKAKAEQELAKACNPQYSVATSLSSVVAQKEFVYKGVKVNDDYSKFMINNYVRVLIDEVMYKMRITSIDLKFPITDKIEVTFSNVTNCKTNTAMNIKEILDSAASIATSYDYVATQADKGAVANDQFANIMNEGLNASLMAVKNSRDQDVVIDNHGILLRKKIHETDEYSPYQMKLINRNIVMTDDNWKTAKMAIGLGMYEGVERYGVWADVICGNLLCGNKLAIYGGGDGTTGNATVIIDGNGITLDGGAITWKTPLADGVVPQSAVSGLPDTLKSLSKDIEQLDGRIQTYSQSDDPSTSWNEDEKSKHKGDIWFNPSDGLTKRWDGTKWNVVTDSNLVALAQSKGQIFTTQPTPPYNVGDLWIGNNESDLLRCQTPKKSGENFDIKDWIVGVKYTDDTMAEKALSELADIGKDGVITPTEKQQIKLIINDISSTKSSVEKQCEAYNIKEEDVPLYKTYLDTYSSLISMVSTLLSDMSKTSSTPSNFNSLFSSYYTALENMTSVIEEASKKYASDVASGIKTDLQEQIDGKIETFYQSTVPTWDASENSKHIGDLWYNTSSTDVTYNSKTYSAKTNYRFNGTSWEENSIIPKDFYDAVDGKSTVYSSIPTTPQDRDLLIPGADITIGSVTYKKGKVYRYNSSNSTWSEINYTDDTALQEMLTSISADDKLSVAEKSYIKKQMDEIAKEYASIQARAEKYSIWNTSTSYQTAYTNLNNYISPLLSKMDEVSSITKSTFDNKFSDYYTELGVVNGLIDVAIQSAAESTASKDLNAYKQEVDEFKELVDSNLSLVGVTKVASDYIYSPKIAGGYAYFTKDNYSVEIDPSHSAGNNTLNGYLFAIRDKSKSDSEQIIMSVNTSGKGYFSGEINAKSGYIGGETGWRITNSSISNSGSGIIRTVDSSDTKVFSWITSGTIYSQGFDGDTISGSYKYLDIHNGAADFNRVDDSSFKNRTVITSDVIIMYDANGEPWNIFNTYENTIDIGIDQTTSCNFGCSPKFNNGATIYNGANISGGLRMYISEYDYCQLGATALDSSAMNAYFTVNSSSSIRYRLQVGDEINNLHTDFSFYVKGTSYITGTSYTNSGTTVTSDRNKKNSISTPSDCYINLFDNINLRQFKYNDGTSDRLHLGVIAQELEEAMSNVGISNKDFGGLVIDKQGNYFVRYDEINMLTALKVKQLESRVKELEAKIKLLT